ncbi:MAG: radical SAM protein [Clostridia bacterium]|nr:radical SAM protein [Clostridia bacterium]
MRHKNIPVFIPHLGCPNDCVFCNQRKITEHLEFKEEDVKKTIDEAVSTLTGRDEAEIAFFGGSFTGIDRDLMIRLLSLGRSYIEKGAVSSLRCSTRPDYIDDEILGILKEYGVKTVELGIQSTDDTVLQKCRRGHTAAQSFEAMRMIKDAGFCLIGQMMTGLPAATAGSEIKTAEDICRYADGARIYPIVVFKDTELAYMAEAGEYTPYTADELIRRTADVKEVFIARGIPTIRVGLQSNEGLVCGDEIACGVYDGAIGEKCDSLIYFRRISKLLSGVTEKRVKIYVPAGHVSRAAGHKKENKQRLRSLFGLTDIKFIEKDIPPYTAELCKE